MKKKFYETPEFASFIKNYVIPGNGENIYKLLDDGSVSEYTNANEYCPAEHGHIVFSVRRSLDIKTVAGYIGMYRKLDEYCLLGDLTASS